MVTGGTHTFDGLTDGMRHAIIQFGRGLLTKDELAAQIDQYVDEVAADRERQKALHVELGRIAYQARGGNLDFDDLTQEGKESWMGVGYAVMAHLKDNPW